MTVVLYPEARRLRYPSSCYQFFPFIVLFLLLDFRRHHPNHELCGTVESSMYITPCLTLTTHSVTITSIGPDSNKVKSHYHISNMVPDAVC